MNEVMLNFFHQKKKKKFNVLTSFWRKNKLINKSQQEKRLITYLHSASFAPSLLVSLIPSFQAVYVNIIAELEMGWCSLAHVLLPSLRAIYHTGWHIINHIDNPLLHPTHPTPPLSEAPWWGGRSLEFTWCFLLFISDFSVYQLLFCKSSL